MKTFPSLRTILAQQSGDQYTELQHWRERIFVTVVNVAASVGSIAFILNAIAQIKDSNWLMLGITSIAYLWLLSIALFKRIPYNLRAISSIALLYLLGVATGLVAATAGGSRIWLVTASVLAAVFLGGRAGAISTGINFVTWLVMGLLFQQGILDYSPAYLETLIQPTNFSLWVATGGTSLVVGVIMVASIAAIVNNLSMTLKKSQGLTEDIKEKTDQLQEQTETLTRRSQALEISAHISRSLTSILDPEQLLYQAAKQMQEEFGLLHVGIFLVNQSGTEVDLQTSSGGGGKTVPAHGFHIPLEGGLIGWIISHAQPRAVLEGEDDPKFSLRVKLPDARSYAALPLRARARVLGAITVQSQQPLTFGPDTLAILQLVTDQIASLLDNAQLFVERETALESERQAYRELTRTAWKDFLRDRPNIGYRRDRDGITHLEHTVTKQEADSDAATYTIPIRVRGETLGSINAQKSSGAGPWTSAETGFLETLSDRLESTLDTARLYEETQRRATEEQLISETTSRIRETLDIETVLQTAAIEMREALGLDEAEVWVIADQSLGTDAGAELHAAKSGDSQDRLI